MTDPHADTPGLLVSVNVGTPRTVDTGERTITTAIWKDPVDGRVPVVGVNVRGDDQADRRVHGGRDKAIYAYAMEDTEWWALQTGKVLGPGVFGENLTTRGIDVSGALIGERWEVGSVLLEVCQPRLPCFKLGLRHDDPEFPKRFGLAGRLGAYLRVLREGDVAAGDAIEVVHRPGHDVTIAEAGRIYLHDHAAAGTLLAADALPQRLLAWAAERAGD